MAHLLGVGKHAVTVQDVKSGPTHTRIGFMDADGRSAVQVLRNDQLAQELQKLECASIQALKGRPCFVQTELACTEPGVEVARVVACQWTLNTNPKFGTGLQA